MPYYFANAFAILLQIILFLIAVYYFGIALFSLFPGREIPKKDKKLHFAVVIPAHNEGCVLSGLLRSLYQQTYPKENYRVFVMADNCTDNTAEVATSFSATVLFRKTTKGSGKGSALKDVFHQIFEEPESYDAMVVIDADNIADHRFLEEINHAMEQGYEVVQGYIDSKNPNNSWVSHAYSVWYWISNRILQMGFHRLGIGGKLGGTGFAITTELLKKIPWETITMAEDAEYTTMLTLHNQKIGYAHKAVVFDEKPTSLRASLPQRVRWAQGITEVQRDLSGKLLSSGKWNGYLRFWSDLLMPLTFLLFLVLDIFAILNLFGVAAFRFVSFWAIPLPFILLNFYLLGMVSVILCGLIQDKKCNRKLLLNLFGFSVYLLTWIPAGLIGILNHRKKEWYHTKHQSGI